MDLNESLLEEFVLLRTAIERIADSLESIDEKLEDFIITDEFEDFLPDYDQEDEYDDDFEEDEDDFEEDEDDFDEEDEEEDEETAD
jgi:segregation and condensation protein B